ncbi:MAG: hypothetical protein ACFFCC_20070, partial [Promethearchaeota archaeon]
MAEENNNEIKDTSNISTKNATKEEFIQNETTEVESEPQDSIEKEEIKQLEEKDHFELEYFS